MNRLLIGLLALALGCADNADLGSASDLDSSSQKTEEEKPRENNTATNNEDSNENQISIPTEPSIFVQASVNFGEVTAGTSKTMSLQIANMGTELTISNIEMEGVDFELEDVELPLVLAAGEEIELHVHLTPSASTERTGIVRVMSDDPHSPIREAQLVANELCGVLDKVTTILENTAVGESYTSTVTLTNCSEVVEIHVTGFEHSPTGNPNYASDFTFSEVATPFILPPGEKFSFDVIFQPLTPGDHGVHFQLSTTGTVGINRSQFAGRVAALAVSE